MRWSIDIGPIVVLHAQLWLVMLEISTLAASQYQCRIPTRKRFSVIIGNSSSVLNFSFYFY